ncbi:Glyoxalase/bleomycin resistance protein/dioxygenase [Natronococcus amylolyticus DSM 10524]|uniref:Glyoxalase/bleomycin resistance protein/dioxygenase n=1 Tax=Natronococcus amylolyticus DSM 10524 TaxID=1227497 RepID=L9X4B8_9EURY|nr:VOC family protein [Natronococcus amylolyticus]ELY55438.1 Glyoxalase/bleomycin resistance protein/dioxygenase [Natronococcus amylolyticus DSM 10524]
MATEGTLPAATRPGRVSLRVTDLERVVRFYEDVLGLEARAIGDDRAVLAAGETPLVVLREEPELEPRGDDETGLFHTALLVPSRAALGDALERIERRWRLDGTADHVVSEALYLADPEGNGIEVYRDRPREKWPVADDGTVGIGTEPLDVEGVRSAGRGRGGVPDGTTVGHLHLEVSSLPAAREFYVGTVGFGCKQRVDGALFVAAGGYHHHLGLNVWRRRSAPPQGRGLERVEVVVPDENGLAALRTRLEEAGHATSSARDDGAFGMTDPDGIELRFRRDDPSRSPV